VTDAKISISITQGHRADFVPETFYNDFSTVWTQFVVWGLEVWGFPIVKCTYRESVANLALASGLRYTGSMWLSYPRQRIDEIIKFQEGYTVKKANGELEPLPQGWELRAVKECRKLARCHRNRVFFILLCKFALQVNLQITFIIIKRIHQKRLNVLGLNNVVGIIALASLLLTLGVEILDIIGIAGIFFRMRSAVIGTILTVGKSSKVYAANDFIVDEEDASIQSIIHSGKDLKAEYYITVRFILAMFMITFFSMWLIGYALLKAACSVKCEHGAWEFSSGCLNPMSKKESETASYCFGSYF